MRVKLINKSHHPAPSYATSGAAGMDLRANLSEPLVLGPLERCLVPTGLFIELPEGYEAQIRPRSGLALKHGISLPNSPGTIDSDYRGELKILMINLSLATRSSNGNWSPRLMRLPTVAQVASVTRVASKSLLFI